MKHLSPLSYTAIGSAVIAITSCIVENNLTCDIQAVDER